MVAAGQDHSMAATEEEEEEEEEEILHAEHYNVSDAYRGKTATWDATTNFRNRYIRQSR